MDLLEREIKNYFLYALFMPNAQDVVSRTIDIFFDKSEEGVLAKPVLIHEAFIRMGDDLG